MAKPFEDTFKKLYKLYASDLSLSEIERLIKRDAPGVYDFYLREAEQVDQQKNVFDRTTRMVINLFEAFLRKLTPSRRLMYSLILFLFIYAFVAGSWLWAVSAFFMLNMLLAFELADKLTAKDELEVARDIQMNLMPTSPPRSIGFDIACFSEAAREVGGDYYDFIQPACDPDKTYVMVGDVSGKGMGAALHMVQVQALLHSLIEQHHSPKAILTALNSNVQPIFRRQSFFTINMISVTGRSLRFCRAGHVPLLVYRSETGLCEALTPAGIGIGLQNGSFDDHLSEVEITVNAGDVLCLTSDGVVETMNAGREEYGDNRLKRTLCDHATDSADAIQNAILKSLATFRGANPPHDDLTLVIMKTC